MDIGVKRLILIVLSVAGGIGLTFFLLWIINVAYNANATPATYGTIYMVLTAIPFALLVAVWLDYFLGTNILPHVDEQE